VRLHQILRDDIRSISESEWSVCQIETGVPGCPLTWHVLQQTLRGGRQEGVEIIEVDNGVLRFTIVPTRGFAIWNAYTVNLRLGWDSPVSEIVHPRFVDLSEDGGRAWLRGFGAWIDRCGFESIGPPCSDGGRALTMHGRASYIPACFVECRYESEPTPRILLRGIVEERVSCGVILQLETTVITELGQKKLIVSDKLTNLGTTPQEWQAIYHINFGPPFLGTGSQFIASVKDVTPRDPRSAEGDITRWNSYDGPYGDGYTEQVFLTNLNADAFGETTVMLRSPTGNEGVALTFNVSAFPHFVLWKNEVSSKVGYVTGLEPSTSYPYDRATERSAGRVPVLYPGESRSMQIVIEALTSETSIATQEEAIRKLQKIETESSHQKNP